jgi:hypothetical protein
VLAAFAFAPPLAVEATQTMDYAFGLAFFLAAWLAAKRGHPLTAGILMALATGCRPTYALVHLAFFARFAVFRAPLERWIRYLAGAVPLTIALFVPVLLAPEARQMEQHLARHVSTGHVTPATAPALVRHAALFLFGSWGTPLLVLGALAAVWRRVRRPAAARAVAPLETAAELSFAGALAVAIGGFWLLIPYAAAYLMPLFPVALLWIARAIPRPWSFVVVAGIAVETFVSLQYRPPALAPGALPLEMDMRRVAAVRTGQLLAESPEVPTVYVVGREEVLRLLATEPSFERLRPAWVPFHGPGLALVDPARRRGFAAVLDPGQVQELEGLGWRVEDRTAGR